MNRKVFYPPEILELIELGKQGKLWHIEVLYNIPGDPVHGRMTKFNLTSEKLKQLRESMFRYGFDIPVAKNHWRIICPMDVLQVDLFKQETYIPEVVEE